MMKNRKPAAVLLALSVLLSWNLSAEGQYEKEASHIKLATTTSTENSGLLAELLPVYQEDSGIIVDVIAVGTGKAIALGENGDVDVILVHARSREDAFVEGGYGVNRRDVMHNDFVLLGPSSDPAGIKGMNTAADALAAVAASESDFMSRGDDSGTHTKEKSLWKAAGLSPSGEWYKETGQGMGAVLTMTNEVQGYTMTDRGTWLAMKDKLDLEVLVEGDPILFNPYGVIAVNPELHSHTDYEGAMSFITFLTGPKGQAIIRDFKKNGEPLFYPDAMK
ncbi:MAG: substrate-binding domain-containing protein [Spirochaetales bacterium]|nr:substrate-binding domain-containing protein [Spirochaetales bacterium]